MYMYLITEYVQSKQKPPWKVCLNENSVLKFIFKLIIDILLASFRKDFAQKFLQFILLSPQSITKQ